MQILAPDAAAHQEPLRDLFAETFTEYSDRRDLWTDGYVTDSSYDWTASRIAVEDDRVVAHYGVWDFTMRVGRSSCRVAGIGAVATLRSLRGRGVMARTAADCVAGLRAAGYDMSLLFGIPDFYQRFGYVVSFRQGSYELATRDVTPFPAPAILPYSGDVTALADAYNRENEGVTGTFVRPTFRRNRWPRRVSLWSLPDGYLATQRQDATLQVIDCVGDPELVIAAARELAVREVCPKIEFVFLPPRSRMGEYLRAHTHRYTCTRHAGGGPMVRICNLPRLLGKLADELSSRLSASPLATYEGTLLVEGDGEAALVRIASGRLADVTAADPPAGGGAGREPDTDVDGALIGGAALGRLATGDDDPLRICRQDGIALSGDARHLVPILFPDQEPSTVMWDRF